MRVFKIEPDPRLISRRVRTAIKGSVIRALIELITNSDDSYRRLEGENVPVSGRIEILYDKQGHRCRFVVRDEAAGMSYEEVCAAFEKYGAATSGYKDGKAVSGFFGTGAKNALGGMTDGTISAFKDDTFTKCRVFFEGDNLMGEIDDDPQPATDQLRRDHGCSGNGTVAYFTADPQRKQPVPRFDNLQECLANHWRLRKIMADPNRRVRLVSVGERKKSLRLKYPLLTGKELLNEDFVVSTDDYGGFPVHISLWRAESELSQSGDDREGGLLILDEAHSVLDLSLFKHDNESLAARFFGEVVIRGFRELLEREVEEPVLKEEREGLDRGHPVCSAVISEVEKRVARMVEEEQRRQRESRSEIDDEERARYRGAFKILNEMAELETEVENLGQEPSDQIEAPPNGLCIYPDSAHITVGKRYTFEVRIDTRKVRSGSRVSVSSSSPKVRICGRPAFTVPRTTGAAIVQRYIAVEGLEAGACGTLRAIAGERCAEASILIDPEKEEKEDLLSEGLVFRPQTLTVRINKVRKSVLRVYVKIIPGGSTIALSCDKESVHVWPEEIVVNEADAKRHVAEYPIEVYGDEPNETAVVEAEHEGHIAFLEVRVKLREEEEKKERGKGMFSDPYFDQDDPEPLQRTSYSQQTGRVTIYVHFPSVKHYLGEGCRYKKSLAAQVLIADLVAERCFLAVAQTKVTRSGALLSPEGRTPRIQRESQELSKKYGHRVHRALVDRALLEDDRAKSGEERTAKRPTARLVPR